MVSDSGLLWWFVGEFAFGCFLLLVVFWWFSNSGLFCLVACEVWVVCVWMVRICDFVFGYWFLVLVVCLFWIAVGNLVALYWWVVSCLFCLLWGCRNIVPGF